MLKRLISFTIFALCFEFISAQIIGFAEAQILKDSAVAAWSFEGNLKDITDNGNDGNEDKIHNEWLPRNNLAKNKAS